MKVNYVATDISGRLSDDKETINQVKAWMQEHNANSGDCVVWQKPNFRIVSIRVNGEWKDF